MNVIRHDWWATPVWEIQTGFDRKFNNDLLVEISKCAPPKNQFEFNIWDYTSPNIVALKNKILQSIIENAKEQLPSLHRTKVALSRGWVNRQQPGETLGVHYHGGTLFAVTYYIYAPDNCGDLLLIDPRGGVNSEWKTDGNLWGAKFSRIKPEESKLVIFPAYILHMVDINRSGQTRVSLATNIYTT